MSPLSNPEEASSFMGGRGRFFNPNKTLQPGQSFNAKVVDVVEDHKAKYKIVGKTYAFDVSLEMDDGSAKRWTVNSINLAGELMKIVYPKGASGGFVPGFIKVTKKTTVGPKQSGLTITKGTAFDDPVSF